MKNLDDVRIRHQVEQWLEIEIRLERVDRGKAVLAGKLYQAEFRPIGPITHELGIDGDIRFFGEFATEFFDLSRRR